MKKFVAVIFDGIHNVDAIQFESNRVQSVSPKQLSEELKEGDYTLLEPTFVEYYLIWDTKVSPTTNIFLLERELAKARAVLDNYDYKWLIQYLLDGINYEPHHEVIIKAFGSLYALRSILESEVKDYEER